MIEQIAWTLFWVAVGYGAATGWKRYRQWRWMRRMAKSMLPVMTSEPRDWFTLKNLTLEPKGKPVQNKEWHQFKLDTARLVMRESGVKLGDLRWEAGGLPFERARQERLAREIVMSRGVPTHRPFGGGVDIGWKEANKAAEVQCHCGAKLTGEWKGGAIVVACGTHGVIYTQGVRP